MHLHLEYEEQLPLAHVLEHISPSSLKMYMNCPHKFYQFKLGPNKEKVKSLRMPQSTSAAFGSAFDCFIKDFLSKEFKIGEYEKSDLLESLLTKEIPDHETRDKVVPHARVAFELYLDTAYEYIKDEGVYSVNFEPKDNIGLAHVFGKVDLVQYPGRNLDWKCRGYMASSKSPHPGYIRSWKFNKKSGQHELNDNPHKRAGENFEEINMDWAIQLLIYAFMSGHKAGEELIIAIDEISMRNVKTYSQFSVDKLVVSQIRAPIGQEFQIKIFWLLQQVWARSKTGIFPKAEPLKMRCNMYGELCPASSFCKSFIALNQPSGDEAFDQLMSMF